MQRCTGAPRRRTATCRSDGITAAFDLAADETTLLRPPDRGALTAFEPRHLAIARMRVGQAPTTAGLTRTTITSVPEAPASHLVLDLDVRPVLDCRSVERHGGGLG